MRIALVWNAPMRLVDITTRFEPYVEGLRLAGADALTVCPVGTQTGFPYPVRTFSVERELTQPQFWRELECEAVVMITWHRMTEILTAARAAGVRTLAIGDSDGQVSPRFHPWPTFRFMTFLQQTARGKLGAAKHWLQRYLFQCPAEHRSVVANAAASDILTLAGQGPVDEFRRFLHRIGESSLANRVVSVPYPVHHDFCNRPIPTERPNRVIAVGRWESLQKNSSLLVKTVRLLAADSVETEVVIVGNGGKERFARLARKVPNVQILGLQPRNRVLELMAKCRAIVIPSRWESGPIVAGEMLALGGTVVGTPIPSLRGITADGQYGRVSRSHSPRALARAVAAEMNAWEAGERDPTRIAAHWRSLVSPEAVARRLLDLLALSPKCVTIGPALQ